MLGQAFMRPGLGALKIIVVGVEADKVDSQFAAHDQLFEKGLFRGAGRLSLIHRERYSMRSQMPEMKIRREMAGCVQFRVITVLHISRQSGFEKSSQALQAFISS